MPEIEDVEEQVTETETVAAPEPVVVEALSKGQLRKSTLEGMVFACNFDDDLEAAAERDR